jgi:hypothetical protein
MMTSMSSLTQRFLDNFPTIRAILAGIIWRYSYCYHSKYLTKILYPLTESRPCSIRNRLSEFSVFYQIPHLQIDLGNQVVRLDHAPCQLHGKISTLPTYFEVFATEAISRFYSIFRTFLGSRELTGQSLENFF